MAIYMWRESEEYITYKMNADSSGKLYVPTGGYNHSGSVGVAYNWKVSVDGGAETTYSGTGSSGGSIALSGYTSGTNHTITIAPVVEDYGWALAYGWYSVSSRIYVTELVHDVYKGFAVSATDTGEYFRYRQFYNCTGLTTISEEILPETVTTIGGYFRGQQFGACTSLTQIKGWKDLSVGNYYYRWNMFYNCTANKTIKVLSDVGYATYNYDALNPNYITQVQVPSAYLNNFKNSTIQPRTNISDSLFVGY